MRADERETSAPGRPASAEALVVAVAAVVVVLGLAGALARTWICDDAFISFRYADHLVRGHGLVFNIGERVEGYTNFLWTLWVALGLKLGFDAERWAAAWGIAAYAAVIILLAVHHVIWRRRMEVNGATLPLAAVLAALHADGQVYASGGLETSWFGGLALAAYLCLVETRWLALSGFLFGLTALTRPDGMLFAFVAGLFVLCTCRPVVKSTLRWLIPFLVLVVPHMVWRIAYYGDIVPNTYYAKSAFLPWYSQGWVYVRLYFVKYWTLLLGFPLLAAVLAMRRRRAPVGAPSEARFVQASLLAAAMALVYAFYVMRVGGDFMYARFLIPTMPFCAVVLDLAVLRLTARRPVVNLLLGGALALALLLTPHPLQGGRRVSGIINEWSYLSPLARSQLRDSGLTLRRYFEGLPVRMAFFGSQARLVYYSGVAVAVESQTGLTDRFIARQPLAERGRVGHEKTAPASYLTEKRRVHFTIMVNPAPALGLDPSFRPAEVRFDDVPGYVLTWDDGLMAALKARGAVLVP